MRILYDRGEKPLKGNTKVGEMVHNERDGITFTKNKYGDIIVVMQPQKTQGMQPQKITRVEQVVVEVDLNINTFQPIPITFTLPANGIYGIGVFFEKLPTTGASKLWWDNVYKFVLIKGLFLLYRGTPVACKGNVVVTFTWVE